MKVSRGFRSTLKCGSIVCECLNYTTSYPEVYMICLNNTLSQTQHILMTTILLVQVLK